MLAPAEGRPDFRSPGNRENLHQSSAKKHFVPIDQQRQNSSANHLGSKEWEFKGSVSGLVLCKQERHPRVLALSPGYGWLSAVSCF